jgi:hypothetical protein
MILLVILALHIAFCVYLCIKFNNSCNELDAHLRHIAHCNGPSPRGSGTTRKAP